jgi:hypothetical protein
MMKRVDKHRDRCLLLKPIISQPASLSVSLNIFENAFFSKNRQKKLLKISLVCDTTTRTLYASGFGLHPRLKYEHPSFTNMVLTRVECYFDTPNGTAGKINHLDLDLREHDSPSEVKKQIAILTDVPYKNLKLRLNMDYGLTAFDTRNRDIKVGTCGVSVSCDNPDMLDYKNRNSVGKAVHELPDFKPEMLDDSFDWQQKSKPEWLVRSKKSYNRA